MKIRTTKGSIGCVLGVAAAMTAQADESQPTVEMKKVVVSATRIETNVEDVPRPVAVVEKEQIEQIQPRSVAQAVQYEPNVTISGGPRPENQTVNIRGLSDNKVLQTIDGVQQRFESGHRPSYFLDPELLSSVEVVKGPASSLWGSGALGGVVAQNTISGGDLLSPDSNVGGFVKAGYNNNSADKAGSAGVGIRAGSVDLLLSGYYRDSDDIKMGNGEDLVGSARIAKGALGKVDWQVNDDNALSFNYRAANSLGSVPSNGAAPITLTSNPLIKRENDTQNFSIDYDLDTESEALDMQVLAYWTKVKMDEARISDGRADSTEKDTFGININNLTMVDDIELLYGVDGYRENFKADRSGTNRPEPPEAKTTVAGAFFQAGIPFASSWKVDLGVRYDRFATKADNLGTDRSDSAFSPSAALIWNTTDWMRLVLRHDRAFRAPSSEELYTVGTHFCMFPGFCNTFVSNPDLDPEKAANTELMGRWQFSDMAGNDQLVLTANIFYNQVDNFIEQIVTGPSFFPPPGNAGITTWVNVDKALIHGFEVDAAYQWKQLNASLSYGRTRGKDDKSDEYLSGIPADTWVADINYGFLQGELVTGVRGTYALDQKNVPSTNNNEQYDGYAIGDIYVTWAPSGTVEGLKIDLAVNNFSNRHYRVAFEELYMPGREVVLSAKYSF